MALGFQEHRCCSVTKRRRFLKDDKVEVRSVEEGFHGSWHPGTVIESSTFDNQFKYTIKYDHILVDNGSDHFVDSLYVSEFVNDNEICKFRGIIRPLPPPLGIANWGLYYGMCVDVYHNEGWWEGVVFDHEDGSEARNVFFPDLGDEMRINLAAVRITQDWDEVTGSWKIRRTWLFLELIEEYENEHYVPVSVKQLWYDLRQKASFQKLGEWTSSEKDLWKILVSETIGDNLRIVMDHLSRVIGLPDLQGLVESVKPVSDGNSYPRADLIQNHAMIPIENTSNDMPKSPDVQSTQQASNVQQLENLTQSDISSHEKAASILPQVLMVIPLKQEGFSSIDGNKTKGKKASSMCKYSWLPAGPDMVHGAKFCPDAVNKYLQMGKKDASLFKDIKNHLSYLNWKIEYSKDNKTRVRYISPNGKIYYSLHQVCLALSKLHAEKFSSMSQGPCPGDSPSVLVQEPPDDKGCVVSSHADAFSFKPEYCPEALVDWYKFGYEGRLRRKNKREELQKMTLRAREHLSAVGWKFRYVSHCGRRELRCISPNGKSYNSLRVACKDAMNERAPGSFASTRRHLEWESANKVAVGKPASGKISYALPKKESLQLGYSSTEYSYQSKFRNSIALQNLKVGGIKTIQKKRKERLLLASSLLQQEAISDPQCSLSMPRKGKKIRGLIKLQDNRKGTRRYCVHRSSKRVQQVGATNPSHHKPRTILSWLIDNNVLLPRAKVSSCSRKGRCQMAEGRISRDGIKCNCCGKVYSLSGFKFHFSGKYHRPASSIFLEDGRSLLDCQMQIVHEEVRSSVAELPENLKLDLNHGENDNICSVCHYGGELLLCDQCPSSFHKNCIGIVDVPDGDWFCPSCCCKICGDNKLKRDTEYSMNDAASLNCAQCERKYHIRCLRIEGKKNLKSFPKGNWFCSKKCKKIFMGLSELIGKPIPVGLNNLTWTLLKSINSVRHKLDAFDIEALTENCSKLSIALEIMHECFEPVEEPHTKRDLLKDVIFSKRSNLNRLNFGGFYTVILQRDDEIVTVATVRVHGEKVAEIPLVGTRFQYRRLGMCRILMNVLEKKLMELGIERLVLPAVPTVLNTWTGSFGFSKLTVSERLQFVDYTFLDFQDTVMCHKLLTKIPSAESCPSREVIPRLCNNSGENCNNMDVDGSTAISEVFRADKIETGNVDQSQADVTASSTNSCAEGCIDPMNLESEYCARTISQDRSVDEFTGQMESQDVSNGSNTSKIENRYDINAELKYYRRRRILACNS